MAHDPPAAILDMIHAIESIIPSEVQQPLTALPNKSVNQGVLEEIIRRIVKTAQPERVIMFGSAVRGEMGPNSDVDLLVIKRGKFDQGRLTGAIYLNLHGVGQAVDVIVVTSEQVERDRDAWWTVICPALREGREVYPPQRHRGTERKAWTQKPGEDQAMHNERKASMF